MFTTINVITASALAVFGIALGPLSCLILNKIPAKWLCDYDETPSEELLNGKRFSYRFAGAIMSVVLALVLFATTVLTSVNYALMCVVVLYIFLMLISASDAKYTIIPDQFTIAVAVISAGYAALDYFTAKEFITTWYSPLLGALAGAGVLIVLDIFSTLVFKKAGFGFGDIKLMAALGLMFGLKYVLVLLVLASFSAAIHFLFIIFTGKAKRGIYLPMGPYICLGTAFTIMLQPQFKPIFDMYKTLMEMEVLP